MSGEEKGDPGNGATVEELERYLLELLEEEDPYGEAAFIREEVVRRIASLRHTAHFPGDVASLVVSGAFIAPS